MFATNTRPEASAVTEMRAGARPDAAASLSVDGQPIRQPRPLTVEAVGAENVQDQFAAVINVHDCDLHQIEVAIAANQHEVDPHPAKPGAYLKRHPVYLVAFDHNERDDQGRPKAGAPRELDLDTIRTVFSKRHDWVAPGDPPEDGSHVRVAGMHTIAELDSAGRPTGRVRLGSPEDLKGAE